MLKKIVINNFRCFKKFQLGSLKQLNVIVGDNNSGKTAFLEAVSIVCKPQLKHLFWLVQQRIENPDSITSIQEELDFLFNNANEKEEIDHFGFEKNRKLVDIEVDDNDWFGIEKDFMRINLTEQSLKKGFALHTGVQELKTCSRTEFINNQHLLHKDFSKSNTEIELELYEWDKDLVIPIKKSPTHIFIKPDCQFQDIFLKQLETFKFEDRETWKNDVLPFLQKIYPDLVGVEFGRNSRIIIETSDSALPLSYMGDGFKKAFYLFLAVYCCKDGVLVIDELETGIHYENQLAVWQILLSASKKFNTQLFISTHSYEMLEYLQKAIENLPQEDKTHFQEQLSLYSFVKLNNKPSSYYYDYSSFDELVKSKWELR